jgi:nitrite reductase/ring-hydroxylating ferredoxin subunit
VITSVSTHRQMADDVVDLVVPPQGENGFDECWYPLAMSDELEEGQSVTLEFLGDRVSVFRTESGVAQAMSPYCAHMGADLGLGEVVGETLQCPFHHWCYGTDGACVHIPAAPKEPIPSGAQVFTYPTVEQYGIIWIYNGTTPAYDVPTPPGVDPAGSYYLSSGYRPASPGDPWLHTVNIVDLQHIVFLHGSQDFPMQLDTPLVVEPHRLEYAFDLDFMGPAHARHSIVGTNVVAASIWRPDGTLVWGWMMPMLGVPGGRSQAFRVAVIPKVTGDDAEREFAEGFFEHTRRDAERIRDEDEGLVHTIRPRPRNLLAGPDDYLRRTLEYFRDYPRCDPAEAYR